MSGSSWKLVVWEPKSKWVVRRAQVIGVSIHSGACLVTLVCAFDAA